jgi:hypothetical protein
VIALLNPAALAGLAAIAAPIVIHLLRQHRASRVLFPSLRFIHPSRTAAIRLRRLADPWLLLLRVAAMGFAACALAQPVWLTESRLSGWNARVARAIVVDTSDSMSLYGARTAAREAADAESRAAITARRFTRRTAPWRRVALHGATRQARDRDRVGLPAGHADAR